MKAHIECIQDEVLKLSTGRYAKMRVNIPQSECENYQQFHLGECKILQDGEVMGMKAYIECIEDMIVDHSTMRYAKLIVTIPEKECGDYQRYHLGECEIHQVGGEKTLLAVDAVAKCGCTERT
jgi:hypothetical protein